MSGNEVKTMEPLGKCPCFSIHLRKSSELKDGKLGIPGWHIQQKHLQFFRYLHWKCREFFKGYKQIFQWVLHGLLLYDVSTWKAPFQMVFGEKSWSLGCKRQVVSVCWYMFSDQGHQRPWRKTTGWCLGFSWCSSHLSMFQTSNFRKQLIRLMEEIRRSPVEGTVVFPIIHKVLCMPGGCLGFLPSTVRNEENLDSSMNLSFIPTPRVFCVRSSTINNRLAAMIGQNVFHHCLGNMDVFQNQQIQKKNAGFRGFKILDTLQPWLMCWCWPLLLVVTSLPSSSTWGFNVHHVCPVPSNPWTPAPELKWQMEIHRISNRKYIYKCWNFQHLLC